jgi:hypothetical protein
MTKQVTTLVVAMMLAATAVHANGLHLNWNRCAGSGAQSNQVFDCKNAEAHHLLVLEFEPPAMPNCIAVDVVLDLAMESMASLPSFWHFEINGCNGNGLSVSTNRSVLGTGVSGCSADFTGSIGSAATPYIAAYGPGNGGPNRARLLMTVVRDAGNPVDLADKQRYYLCHLDFAMQASCESGGECVGCSQPGCWVWETAMVYGMDGSQAPVYGSSLDSFAAMNNAPCGIINGGERGATTEAVANPCEPTGTRGHTWGSIKSLYR